MNLWTWCDLSHPVLSHKSGGPRERIFSGIRPVIFLMCPPDLPFNSRNWHCILDSSWLYRIILHLVYLGYCIHIQNIYAHLLVTRSTTTYPIKWRVLCPQIQCPTLSLDMFKFRYRHPITAYDMSLSGYRPGARLIHSHILSIWVSI